MHQVVALGLGLGRVAHRVVHAGEIDGRAADQFAVRVLRRRRRRRHVVEEAVVLVEIDDQHRPRPDLGIGGQGLDHSGGIGRALGRAGRGWVLAVGGRGDDPRHLRQAAAHHVLAQLVEVLGRQRQVLQALVRTRNVLVGLAIGLEAGQRVVGEVVGHVLVDAPGDAGLQQPLGIGGPAIGIRRAALLGEVVVRVGDRRPAQVAGRVVGPGPQEQAVGVGAGLGRAVIGVAEGEGLGQGELKRDVGPLEIAHRPGLLGLRPTVHAALVPGVLGVGPAVRRALDPHVGEGLGGLQRERRDPLVLVGLGEDRAIVLDRNGEAVAEAAHAGHGPEIVVEAAVLLHQDHHVLDVLDRAGAHVGVDGRRLGQGRRQGHRADRGEQASAVELGHGKTPGRLGRS